MKAGDKEWFKRLLVEMNDRQAAVWDRHIVPAIGAIGGRLIELVDLRPGDSTTRSTRNWRHRFATDFERRRWRRFVRLRP